MAVTVDMTNAPTSFPVKTITTGFVKCPEISSHLIRSSTINDAPQASFLTLANHDTELSPYSPCLFYKY